jgi:hypothetical protein
MKRLVPALVFTFSTTLAATFANAADAPQVKAYLLQTTAKMQAAAADFEKNAAAYQQVIDGANGDYAKALRSSHDKIVQLVGAMQENYKAMDSFGYETIEGIVAGVKPLQDFDVYLDAGVPQSQASPSTQVAPVVLKTKSGRVIDREGCLFTYIIEPALWGSNKSYVISADVNGDGKIDAKESLPRADVISTAAVDVHKKINELAAASAAWQPTTEDYFAAIITMTPTLSGYFDDWKESRYTPDASGKFSAVSRVSDMRGIMSSVAVLYKAVEPQVQTKDVALAKAISRGFTDILSFIDRVDAREKKARITVPEIDELGTQAKEKADKLVPQVEQAAAVLEIKVQGA